MGAPQDVHRLMGALQGMADRPGVGRPIGQCPPAGHGHLPDVPDPSLPARFSIVEIGANGEGSEMTSLLSGRGLVKRYGDAFALAGVDIDIAAGEVLAIVGPSGSGKTSLLHVLAGILKADQGAIALGGQRIDQLNETKRSELRRTEFGFVFQSGMLVGGLTAGDTVALPRVPV